MPSRPPKITQPKLLGAPYAPPRIRRGRLAYDILHGDLEVCGTSDSPSRWPIARTSPWARRLMPVMSDELVRAVRTESVIAIMYHWGVSRTTILRWRKALGVERFNAGTMELWREMSPAKLTPRVRAKALKSYLSMVARRRLERTH